MRIAFYAPMKPPDHPLASGDREMARQILAALRDLGHEVTLASRLSSWQREPDMAAAAAIRARAAAESGRLLAGWRSAPPPELWFTYHLYHKAPDLIGPAIVDALAIPYVVAEACWTERHRHGPWARGAAAAAAALARADAVAAMHQEDADGLQAVVPAPRLHLLAPFIDTARFLPRPEGARSGPVRLIAVGMMRQGDKERSYRVLAAALARLAGRDWQLTLVGDGPCAAELVPLFDPARTSWRGAVEPAALPALYAEADILVWPAVNEAFGMVVLEAQAAGLAIVAGRTGGVAEIVRDRETGLLVPEGDAIGFAAALARLIDEPDLRADMQRAAAAHVRARHSLAAGRSALAALLAHGERGFAGRGHRAQPAAVL